MREYAQVFGFGAILGVLPSAALFGGLPNVVDAYRSFGRTHRMALDSLKHTVDFRRSQIDPDDKGALRRLDRMAFAARAGYWAGMSVPVLGLAATGFGAYRLARRRWLSGALSFGLGLTTLGGLTVFGRSMVKSNNPFAPNGSAGPAGTGSSVFDDDSD
jgi:hypothetical protein